jgi:hypothetical protein
LPGGEVAIRVEAPGYAAATRRATVVVREIARETFKLARSEPPPPAPPSAKADAVPPAVTAPPSTTPSESPYRPHRALEPWAWGAGTLAIAGLAFGVGETVAATNRIHDFNNHSVPDPMDSTKRIQDCNQETLTTECASIQSAYNRARTMAIIGYAAGGALAITSAVLFVRSSSAESSEQVARRSSRPQAVCAPDIGRVGVSCRLVF